MLQGQQLLATQAEICMVEAMDQARNPWFLGQMGSAKDFLKHARHDHFPQFFVTVGIEHHGCGRGHGDLHRSSGYGSRSQHREIAEFRLRNGGVMLAVPQAAKGFFFFSETEIRLTSHIHIAHIAICLTAPHHMAPITNGRVCFGLCRKLRGFTPSLRSATWSRCCLWPRRGGSRTPRSRARCPRGDICCAS